MKNKEDILRSLEVGIPYTSINTIRENVSAEKENIHNNIEKYVKSRTVLKDDKYERYLLLGSYEKISQFRQKLAKGSKESDGSENGRKLILNWLEGLEQLKLLAEQHAESMKSLDRSQPVMSVYLLLQVMFKVVLRAMYPEEWGTLATPEIGLPETPNRDISYTATMAE
jgi:hypothetical protein